MIRHLFVVSVACVMSVTVLAQEPGITLPDWYEANRVQAHSEHSLALALKLTPKGHAEAIRLLGSNVLSRIYLTRDEGAWWQSTVGEIEPLIGKREFAQEISDAVHATGMHAIAYHRHMSDALCQREHPDWVCTHPDGSPMLEPRGKTDYVFVLCMNSPYREYIQTRLVELAERGVDAIYFDNRHMPDVCICRWCQEKFKKETGHAMNIAAPEGSPEYLEAARFVNRTMVEGFQQWSKAVREVNPEVFFVVKTSLYANFFLPHMDTALLRISDVPGTEFNKPFGHNPRMMRDYADFAVPDHDDQMALGWSVVRDGSQGRPPHMWVPHCYTETEAIYSAAAAVTYGCVAGMNVSLRNLDSDVEKAGELFTSSFAMGEKMSPYLAGTRPIPLAAIHISERARDARLPKIEDLWAEVFGVGLGGYRALKEEHVPWTVVSDLDLADGLDPRTRLLVLPWPDELNAKERQSVTQFGERGGTTLRLKNDAGWHLASKLPELHSRTRREVRRIAEQLPIRIAGPERMHAVCYEATESDRLTICLANTWGWFRSTRAPSTAMEGAVEPPPCEDVVITLDVEDGLPTRSFDAITGQELPLSTEGNTVRIKVPTFQINACVVVER